MKKLEGINVHIVFGHYESDDDEHSWLEPDLAKQIELTANKQFNEIKTFKKEFLKQCSHTFDRLVCEYERLLLYLQ